MKDPASDSKHPLSRLVGRYGHAHGMYLYGEFCSLMTLGLEAFQARHTAGQLQRLMEELRPLALWPERPVAPADDPFEPWPAPSRLDEVAQSLVRTPLSLAVGYDLHQELLKWAELTQPETRVDLAIAAWFEAPRAALTETLGFTPPRLEVYVDPELPGVAYRLYIYGEAAEEGEAFPGLDLLLAHPSEAPPPIPYPWEPDPTGSGWISWMPIGAGAAPPESIARIHWLTGLSRHLTARLPQHADRLLTVPVIYDLLGAAEASGYDHELERYVSLPELRIVFKTLLRQGLALRPLPQILEAMLTVTLADLANRQLSHPELERLNRQLPLYATQRLIAVAREALGLPAEPAPRFSLGAAAPPHDTRSPALDDALRGEIEETWRLAQSARPAARFWLTVLRVACEPRAHRRGPFVAESLELPLRHAPLEHPAAIAARLDERQCRAAARQAVRGFNAVYRPLRKLLAYARQERTTLDPETLQWLATVDWAHARWAIAQPERLIEAAGELEAFRRFLGA